MTTTAEVARIEQPSLTPGPSRNHGRVAVRNNVQSLQPQSFQELMQFAETVCRSPFIPKEFMGKPGDILAAVQYGAELGLPAMQALQSICVINGKPSVYGDAMLALVRASGLLEEFKEWKETDEKGNVIAAMCHAKRRGSESDEPERFSMEDAKKAGLLGKAGPWSQYPQRMLMFRARSWKLRDTFGDVLKGIQMAEEAEDYIDVENRPYSPPTVGAPRSLGVSAVKNQIAAKPGEVALDSFIARAADAGIAYASKSAALEKVRALLQIDKDAKLAAADIDRAAELLLAPVEAPVPQALPDDWLEQFKEIATADGYPIGSDEDAKLLISNIAKVRVGMDPDGVPVEELWWSVMSCLRTPAAAADLFEDE